MPVTTALIGLYFGTVTLFGGYRTVERCEQRKAKAIAEHVLGRIELKCVPVETLRKENGNWIYTPPERGSDGRTLRKV
jgi:hypothetical protein